MTNIIVRPAQPEDAPAISLIWFRGWQDGHLGHIPEELVRARTEESFSERAATRIGETSIITVNGEVAGFTIVVNDEVEQVYVAAQHRGSGIAAMLLARAEQLVVEHQYEEAWLAVVAGNVRARRFYERHGWTDMGDFNYLAKGAYTSIVVPSHRYIKRVG